MRFAKYFNEWLRHSWKSLANRHTRGPKIVLHGNSCVILYTFGDISLKKSVWIYVVYHVCPKYQHSLKILSQKIVCIMFVGSELRVISSWAWPILPQTENERREVWHIEAANKEIPKDCPRVQINSTVKLVSDLFLHNIDRTDFSHLSTHSTATDFLW